jgi:hypothetical protein
MALRWQRHLPSTRKDLRVLRGLRAKHSGVKGTDVPEDCKPSVQSHSASALISLRPPLSCNFSPKLIRHKRGDIR